MILAALTTQIVLLVLGEADANSGAVEPQSDVASRLARMLSFFTVDSNVLVAVACVGLVLHPGREGRMWRVLRLTSLLAILITGLVFVTVLASKVHLSGAALWCTIAFHYVAPPATFLGWLVFGPRGQTDWRTLAWSFAWPLAWIGYTLVHGAITDWYPYPFIDIGAIGYPVALRNIAVVLAIGAVLALALRWIDRHLPARSAVTAELGARAR